MAGIVPRLVSTVGPSTWDSPIPLGDCTTVGGGCLGRSSGALRTRINGFPIALTWGAPGWPLPHMEISAETVCGIDLTTIHCSTAAGGVTMPCAGSAGLWVEGSPVHLGGDGRCCDPMLHTTQVHTQFSVWCGGTSILF